METLYIKQLRRILKRIRACTWRGQHLDRGGGLDSNFPKGELPLHFVEFLSGETLPPTVKTIIDPRRL